MRDARFGYFDIRYCDINISDIPLLVYHVTNLASHILLLVSQKKSHRIEMKWLLHEKILTFAFIKSFLLLVALLAAR